MQSDQITNELPLINLVTLTDLKLDRFHKLDGKCGTGSSVIFGRVANSTQLQRRQFLNGRENMNFIQIFHT